MGGARTVREFEGAFHVALRLCLIGAAGVTEVATTWTRPKTITSRAYMHEGSLDGLTIISESCHHSACLHIPCTPAHDKQLGLSKKTRNETENSEANATKCKVFRCPLTKWLGASTCFEEGKLPHNAFATDVVQHFACAVADDPMPALQLSELDGFLDASRLLIRHRQEGEPNGVGEEVPL